MTVCNDIVIMKDCFYMVVFQTGIGGGGDTDRYVLVFVSLSSLPALLQSFWDECNLCMSSCIWTGMSTFLKVPHILACFLYISIHNRGLQRLCLLHSSAAGHTSVHYSGPKTLPGWLLFSTICYYRTNISLFSSIIWKEALLISSFSLAMEDWFVLSEINKKNK